MRNVIQVGLFKTCEWAYLTEDNWIANMKTQKPHLTLPKFLWQDQSPFRYFGVDVSLGSVYNVRQKYAAKNRFFLACGISDKVEIKNIQNDVYYDYEADWYDFKDESNNTYFVFMPLGQMISQLGISDLTYLYLDVDLDEKKVLLDLADWSIKPEMLGVELATAYYARSMEVVDLVKSSGYVHIRSIPQAMPSEVWMHTAVKHNFDARFLRADVFEKYKDIIEIKHEYYYEEKDWLGT